MTTGKTIGVVGGLGPYAGLDLTRKIFDQTVADHDQDHLPVLLVSAPAEVEDRTAFLTGKSATNPGHAIGAAIEKLVGMGADIIGIPCNTAHAPSILDVAREGMRAANGSAQLLHMLDEAAAVIHGQCAGGKVAVLSTTGVYSSGVYQAALELKGVDIIPLDPETQDEVHDVIYNTDYGIKAYGNPVTPVARGKLLNVVKGLKEKGAQVVVLGCTELPLAITETTIDSVAIIDPTLILARALIREAAPEKLRPTA